MRTNIWIRTPYPFLLEEMKAIEMAIVAAYGVQVTYCREWQGEPVDQVIITRGTKAIHQAIAQTIQAIHLQRAYADSRFDNSLLTINHMQIAIGERPEWAQLQSLT